jgi:hypothetical protein
MEDLGGRGTVVGRRTAGPRVSDKLRCFGGGAPASGGGRRDGSVRGLPRSGIGGISISGLTALRQHPPCPRVQTIRNVANGRHKRRWVTDGKRTTRVVMASSLAVRRGRWSGVG